MFWLFDLYRTKASSGKPIYLGLTTVALVLTLVWLPARAQINPHGAIQIVPGGKLWIEGSASIVDYTCKAEQLSGNGNIENTTEPRENVEKHGAVSIEVSIPVRSLECGKRGMNNDMYKALKAEEFPYIRYRLIDAVLADSSGNASGQPGGWMPIRTTGLLTIAGVQDTTVVFVKGKVLSGDRFHVKGSKPINMKTFHIKPPSALLGLIKASRELTVYFDVIVRLTAK